MKTMTEIRQDGSNVHFVHPMEIIWLRQHEDAADMLSKEELSAVQSSFTKAEHRLEAINQSLSGIADLMCQSGDDGIGKTAAINLSGLLDLLAGDVAICNKDMSDAHLFMCKHFERAAMKKAATRANAKAA